MVQSESFKKLIINSVDYRRILENFVYNMRNDDYESSRNFLQYISYIRYNNQYFEFIEPYNKNTMPDIILKPIFENDFLIDLKDFCAELATFNYQINNYTDFIYINNREYIHHIEFKIEQIKSGTMQCIDTIRYLTDSNLKYKEFYLISNSNDYMFYPWNQHLLKDIVPLNEERFSIKLVRYFNMLNSFIHSSDPNYKQSFYDNLNYYIDKCYNDVEFYMDDCYITDYIIYNKIEPVENEYDLISVEYIEFYKELMNLENKIKNYDEYVSDTKYQTHITNIKYKIGSLEQLIIDYKCPEVPKYGVNKRIDMYQYSESIDEFINVFESNDQNKYSQFINDYNFQNGSLFGIPIGIDPVLNIMYNIDYKIVSERNRNIIVDSMEFYKECQSFYLKLENKYSNREKKDYDVLEYNEYLVNLKYKSCYLKKAYSYKAKHYCVDDYMFIK